VPCLGVTVTRVTPIIVSAVGKPFQIRVREVATDKWEGSLVKVYIDFSIDVLKVDENRERT
jgi:hypothetical protein